jgi:hypothetical protein
MEIPVKKRLTNCSKLSQNGALRERSLEQSRARRNKEMQKLLKPRLLVLALVLACIAATPEIAGGTNLGMQLTTVGGQAIICDSNINFPGCTGNALDLNPTPGAITFIGAVGDWDMNVTSGFGPPYETTSPLLDVSTFDATSSTGAGALTILLSVTGLIGPTDPLGEILASDAIGGTNSVGSTNITTQTWLSSSDMAFCDSTSCGSLLNQATYSGATFGGTNYASGSTGAGPYSLTVVVTVDSGGAADTTSFDNSVSVPEPSSISLVLSSLAALALIAFRSRRLRLGL